MRNSYFVAGKQGIAAKMTVTNNVAEATRLQVIATAEIRDVYSISSAKSLLITKDEVYSTANSY